MVRHQAGKDAGTCSNCVACGTEIFTAGTGRPRRYCTDACRKRAKRGSDQALSGNSSTPSGEGAGGTQEPPTPSLSQTSSTATSFESGYGPESVSENEPEGVSGHAQPWYYAKFASPPGQDPISSRRRLRYRLRHLLREVSTVDRCKACGYEPIAGGIVIKMSTSRQGLTSAGFGGLETCGRIWLCPVCAAKIRVRRGDEVAEGVGRHIIGGGGAYFVTATLPHEHGDALAASLGVLTKTWRHLTNGKRYQSEKERFGILGTIKAIEVTHGRNGWHPHIHAVILTSRILEIPELGDWYGRMDGRWALGLVRNGWNAGKQPYRFKLLPVDVSNGSNRLAAYVTKVQDSGLGNELARADMKSGRKSSRTPFEILADFGNDALADDLELWWEYEKATAGRSAIRWSKGLRALLLPDQDEQTDEEVAAEEHDGESIAVLARNLWHHIRQIPGAEVAVLEAVETAGFDGLIRTLMRYRLDASEAYRPEEWATPGAVEIDA